MSNTQELEGLMAAGIRVLLVGPPGCAKTARVHAIAKKLGRRVIVIRAALQERVDFAGAMVPDIKAGVTKALPLDLFYELQHTTEDILLFADDLGQAPIDVQSALMKWFDVGVLSPTVLIWGATNRSGDKAGVGRLHEALRSRFGPKYEIASQVEVSPGKWEPKRATPSDGEMLGTWEDEVASWCEWAMDSGAPPEIIAWHRSTNGRTLYQWKPNANAAVSMPDYRSWEDVMKLWGHGIHNLSTVSAVIGKPVAAEFMQFARLAQQLPTPDQVWMDPNGAPVPKDSSALYLVASMLAAAIEPEHAAAAVTYMSRMPRVYGALLARDMYRKLGASLSGSKEWVRWFTENQELFAVN